jgi:hypothetical protein
MMERPCSIRNIFWAAVHETIEHRIASLPPGTQV